MVAKQHIFFPIEIARGHNILGLGITPGEINTHLDPQKGYRLPGFFLKSPVKKHLEKIKELGLEEVGHGYADEKIYRIFGTVGNVSIDMGTNALSLFTKVIIAEKAVRKELKVFSQITGLKVRFHVPNETTIIPFPEEEGVIDIVLDASPPGEVSKIDVMRIFGIQIDDLGRAYEARVNAIGYGIVAYDDEKIVIGQIINRTFYLFLPIYSGELRLLAESHGGLFQKVLIRIWNTFCGGEEQVQPPSADIADCMAQSAVWQVEIKEANEGIVIKSWEKLRRAEEALFEAQRELRVFTAMSRGLIASNTDRRERQTPEFEAASWKKVLEHPLLERIAVVEKAYEITTKPHFVEYEGIRYPVGQYIARLNDLFKLNVRCLNSPHPKKVPHPHIPLSGNPCYGNITEALGEAQREYDYPTYLLLFLDWLADGYDHSLAVPPITEWPMENTHV